MDFHKIKLKFHFKSFVVDMREAVKRELAKWLSGAERVVVVGIGNPIRMDDYVGIIVIRSLNERVSGRALLLECETVPENYIQQIVEFKPTHILLIDAAILGLRPGEVELLEPKNIELSSAFSTHALPLKVFCEYLSRTTNAKILLLLIQPKKTDFGEGLTPEVLSSGIEIADFLSKILPR
ncbi:hydrogenase 3 maturation endopeptidase HyCI [Candidatus Bathyarchaeota archaeon]|nr:hydrogenase 3 maturation endopeptidase HyCI [Candidatus Bathyarchaeota archaeon]